MTARGNPFTINRQRASQNTMMVSSQQNPNSRKSLQKRGINFRQDQLQGSNFRQEKFLWIIQKVFDQSDPTIALSVNFTTLPGQKRRFLQIQSVKTLLLDYIGSDFPPILHVSCDNLDGYLSEQFLPTHSIATSFPKIGATISRNGITSSNIVYQSDLGGQLWDVSNLTNLTLKIKSDLGTISMPLENSLVIKAKLTRVII